MGDNTGANFGAIGAGTVVASGRTNQWMGGLSAPVGEAGRVLFSISQLRPGGDFDTDFTSTQTNGGIAYTYSLSKRTSLYGSYSYSRNYGMIEGVTVNSIGAGVVHLF